MTLSNVKPARMPQRASSHTDRGAVRNTNQDCVWMSPDSLPDHLAASHGWIYVVSDGMGGYAGGEVASRIVVDSFGQAYYANAASNPYERIIDAVARAHAAVLLEKEHQPDLSAMGATIVALIVIERTGWIVNVGDSRAYLLRSSSALQLSEDHSVIAEGIRKGLLTAEQGEASAMKGILTRAVGSSLETPSPAIQQVQLQDGDRVVLCTDGLWEVLPQRSIAQIVGQARTGDAAAALVRAALHSHDNVSAVVVEVPHRDSQPKSKWSIVAMIAALAATIALVVLLIQSSMMEAEFVDAVAPSPATPSAASASVTVPAATDAIPDATPASGLRPAQGPRAQPVRTAMPTVLLIIESE